jgi:hypothetical protein
VRSELRPCRLVHYAGTRTAELQAAGTVADEAVSLHGATTDEFRAMLQRAGEFDLIINVEATSFSKAFAGLLAGEATLVAGACIARGGWGDLPFPADDRGNLWRDTEWIGPGLTARYPFLRSPFIGEIFARLCYLDGALPAYQLPIAEPMGAVPSVLISAAASLPDKLWPVEKWRVVLGDLHRAGHDIGLLGAPPSQQSLHWLGAGVEDVLVREGLVRDLRGAFPLPGVVGALRKATLALTIDNGIVGLFRHGIHRLWAPPAPRLTVLEPGEGRVVADIPVDVVQRAVAERLRDA